jgi:quercetin dioxygenase-like cupin family protein
MPQPVISHSSADSGTLPFEASGRSFVIQEWGGSGPDYMHVHHSDDEAWHVLEGTLTFQFADRKVDVLPGTTVFVPAGVAHTYYEAYGATRYLIIMTPLLRDLISALQTTPRANHGDVLRSFDSQIIIE